ncbi:hypothetical protein ABT408_36390, partial [Streptomyces halstedii]|uniref:hypothetical protein n=1 Tax=Streptomyces halstedii TaxID=1944 RepID=UPI003363B89C
PPYTRQVRASRVSGGEVGGLRGSRVTAVPPAAGGQTSTVASTRAVRQLGELASTRDQLGPSSTADPTLPGEAGPRRARPVSMADVLGRS